MKEPITPRRPVVGKRGTVNQLAPLRSDFGLSKKPLDYDARKNGAVCDKCPRKGSVVVPPEGPNKASICFIGQDPGRQEVKQRKPFIGPTGARLFKLWKIAWERMKLPVVPRERIWITNASLCMPVTKSNSEAKSAAVCCRPRLLRELRSRLLPHAGLLVMGRWAMFTVTGRDKGMSKYTGYHMKLKELDELTQEATAAATTAKAKPSLIKRDEVPF